MDEYQPCNGRYSSINILEDCTTKFRFLSIQSLIKGSFYQNLTTALTDWSGDALHLALGNTAQTVSLLSGSYVWQANPNVPPPDMPQVNSVAQGDWQPNLALDGDD